MNTYWISVNFYWNFKKDCCLLSWTLTVSWIVQQQTIWKAIPQIIFCSNLCFAEVKGIVFTELWLEYSFIQSLFFHHGLSSHIFKNKSHVFWLQIIKQTKCNIRSQLKEISNWLTWNQWRSSSENWLIWKQRNRTSTISEHLFRPATPLENGSKKLSFKNYILCLISAPMGHYMAKNTS